MTTGAENNSIQMNGYNMNKLTTLVICIVTILCIFMVTILVICMVTKLVISIVTTLVKYMFTPVVTCSVMVKTLVHAWI